MAEGDKKDIAGHVASKFPKLTRKQAFIVLIVFLILCPIGVGLYKWVKPEKDSKPASQQSQEMSGDNNSGVGNIGNVHGNVNLNTSTTPEPKKLLFDFQPIDNLKERIKRLNIPMEPPAVKAKLVSPKWGINENLLISKNMRCQDLEDQLVTALMLDSSLKVKPFEDLPNQSNWNRDWSLTMNGAELKYDDSTTVGEVFVDDCILQLNVTVTFTSGAMNCSGSFDIFDFKEKK